MKLDDLLAELSLKDIKLWADGDQLRIRARRSAITPEIREALASCKAELLSLLHQRSTASLASRMPLVPVPRSDNQPLSFAQERLWFLDQLEPGVTAYNLPLILHLSGRLHMNALEESINAILQRHEILRMTITSVDGRPVQRSTPACAVTLPLVDLENIPKNEREAEAQRRIIEDVLQPFDLMHGPLIRFLLLRLDEQEHRLLFTIHHIVIDGWSYDIVRRELAELYTAFAAGMSSPLPDLPIQYADFASWQRQWLQGEILEQQMEYWKQQLQGAPAVLELPTDRPRPPVQTYRGAWTILQLLEELTAALKLLSQGAGVTLFMTLLAAFQLLLHRYTGQEDIVVGSPIAGRPRREIEGLIGFFVNTLVLRTDLSGNPSFREVLRRVRDTCLGAYEQQDVPFEKLVEELKPERDLSRTPLFQVMFILLNAPKQQLELPNLTMKTLEVVGTNDGSSKFDLTLSITDAEDGLSAIWEYNTDLFNEATIKRMQGHFQKLLEGVVANPDQRLSEIELLTEAEREELLVEWNATDTDYPEDQCIHKLIEAQAEENPEAEAVVFGGEQVTYEALNRRANQFAHYLQRQGVGPEGRVGICVERSVEMVVGLLGILKAGGTYIPLDPSYPSERLAFMLADAQVPVLVTQESLKERLPEHSAQVVYMDTGWEVIGQEGVENPTSPVSSSQLAYIIYTSGSTGKPKGVQIPHRALTNFIAAMRKKPGLSAADTLVAVTTLAFDIAGLELYLPLTVGARVVVVSQEVAADGRALATELQRRGATVMQATPATWRLLIDAGWEGNKQLKILCGGEALPRELAEQLLSRCGSLWNMYGPTETTIWSSAYQIRTKDEAIPIGGPIANTQFYVLDRQLCPVPIGVPGELHIGGLGVARGYINRPELTAERFIHDPFRRVPGAQLYKTGDLARYLPDGTLEFLGRHDHQVKIRGFRIELGEIETVLEQYPAVSQAVVLALEEAPGNQLLVAYIVCNTASAPTTGELRSFLKAKVPKYMVPSSFVLMEALPLLPNGKVDRQALPALRSTLAEADTFIAPRDALELQLIKIWEEVLGVQPIGMQDDFFELGGHSLLAVRLFARIEKLTAKRLPLATLFQASTVVHLASVLRQDGWVAPWTALVPIQPGGSHPPFFCLHSAGGNVLSYRALAQHLGADQPFYGVQAQGLDGSLSLVTQIEEMAAHYLKDIRTLQPQGPYYLGGLCFGGIVASEMAQQLQAQGQQVALLALLDTAGPGYPQLLPGVSRFRFKVAVWMFRRKHHMENLKLLGPSEKIAYMVEKVDKKTGLLKTLCLDATVGRWMHRVVASTETPSQEVLHQLETTNVAAAKKYIPQVYPGTITLFRASKQPPGIVPDPLLGWDGLATEGVEVYEVTGDHLSMLQEPRVQGLATQLCKCLTQARTAAGSGA